MSTLTPDERRQADRLALEIAGLVRDTPGVATKAPLLRAAMTRAMYLLGLDKLIAPEPVPENGEESTGTVVNKFGIPT